MTRGDAGSSGAAARPAALDQAFLELEDGDAPPLHIGWALELDGQPPSVALLRAMLARAAVAVPLLRRRLGRDPLTTALQWLDDPWFDPGSHVDGFAVRSLDDGREVDALLSRLHGVQLPRDRPLWRLQAIDDERRLLLCGQLHHVLADGAGSLAVAAELALAIASTDPADHRPAQLQPAVLDEARRQLARLLQLAIDPAGLTQLATGTAFLAQRLGEPGPAWSAERAIARTRLPLEPLRAGARGHGGTLTAALVVAVARMLGARGLAAEGDEAFVPVNARSHGGGAGEANPVSVVYAPLPTDGSPHLGLRRVTGTIRRQRERAAGLRDVSGAANDLPPFLRGSMTRLVARQFLSPAIVSSVAGPPEPIDVLGRRVRGAWGWAPSPAGQPAALTAVSYAGQLHLTLVTDADAIPDPAEALDVVAGELAAFTTD